MHTKGYKQVIVNTKDRHFPFYVQGSFGESSRLHLFDIPTTLLSSYHTINEFFSPTFLATENTLQRLMDKEIWNFDKTFRTLIRKDRDRKGYSLKII